MNKFPAWSEPVEIFYPRKWWQLRSRRVIQGRWIYESISYEGDSMTIVLIDEKSAFRKYKLHE
jgi:hypothetical protein